jgi:L-amino acid N-acyltransferase YncA
MQSRSAGKVSWVGMQMKVRDADAQDIPAIQAIYAHHVLHGLGTFEETPPTIEDMTQRIAAAQERDLPWLVAEDASGSILGYAYAGPFRTRAAFRFTLEDSIYVDPQAQRQGVGRVLLTEILKVCEAAGYSGGRDCLDRDRRWLSGISAGCVSPGWRVTQGGRSPTGVTRQPRRRKFHAATGWGWRSK